MNRETLVAVTPDGVISRISPRITVPQGADGARSPRYVVLSRILTFGLRVRWKRALLFWGRFAANPLLTIRWWRFAATFAAERGLPPPHDELLQKPLSKFLVHGMLGSRRLSLLIDHFSIAERILSAESMTRLWCGEWLEMGFVQGRSETYACFIALADRSGGRHEGAFAVKLMRIEDKAVLCTVRFTFVSQGSQDRYTFVVGSMQGPRNAKQRIVEVTRDLSGLRPKEAILIVLQGLVTEGGIQHFLAVSQVKHPIQYRRRMRQSMMRSNVDAFWAERSAQPEGTYGFSVPFSKICGADRRSQSKMWFHGIGELFL
ncbi:DUF535 domain-containing protein [Rhizobium sp. P40RR-XXII]|uniref:DUF535 family protein n=1 Tax=unclassified Rhizobium TaxID=2613769 RepID=UPI00145774E9|nr:MULTISPECIES: DUF535 family protein [unclassified Rhizobium]NLR84737.1 DUF535 domain-containing protein [Rhizobium sp. P28RR-XV]NLS16356.1 DUF535 domain-containing protein [Rhizobium sp. P40RR-XXII]